MDSEGDSQRNVILVCTEFINMGVLMGDSGFWATADGSRNLLIWYIKI